MDVNGICSLSNPFDASNQVQLLPLTSPPLICPFWCDSDTRQGGVVYFRLVTEENDDAGLLMRARQEIMAYFIDNQMFEPKYILIVTWEDIGYMRNSTVNENPFFMFV